MCETNQVLLINGVEGKFKPTVTSDRPGEQTDGAGPYTSPLPSETNEINNTKKETKK
jgi:hypothetical protein